MPEIKQSVDRTKEDILKDMLGDLVYLSVCYPTSGTTIPPYSFKLSYEGDNKYRFFRENNFKQYGSAGYDLAKMEDINEVLLKNVGKGLIKKIETSESDYTKKDNAYVEYHYPFAKRNAWEEMRAQQKLNITYFGHLTVEFSAPAQEIINKIADKYVPLIRGKLEDGKLDSQWNVTTCIQGWNNDIADAKLAEYQKKKEPKEPKEKIIAANWPKRSFEEAAIRSIDLAYEKYQNVDTRELAIKILETSVVKGYCDAANKSGNKEVIDKLARLTKAVAEGADIGPKAVAGKSAQVVSAGKPMTTIDKLFGFLSANNIVEAISQAFSGK